MRAFLGITLWAAVIAVSHAWAKYTSDDFNSPSRRSYEDEQPPLHHVRLPLLLGSYMTPRTKEHVQYNPWEPDRHHVSRKRRPCVGSGGKCYSSEQCCRHFVCAAFDDLFGLNPEVPGFCVREKDLHPCTTNMECAPDAKCLGLGRGGAKYCVVVTDEGPAKPASPPSRKYNSFPAAQGSRGDKCESSAECSPTSESGEALCCQKVRRYRQKAKVICDVQTPISDCLP